MLKPTSFAELAMYSTLLLNNKNGSATGFIFETKAKTYVVIANRHFVEGAGSLNYSINQLNQDVSFKIHLDNGSTFDINGNVSWYLHPKCDLAFFELNSILLKSQHLISGAKWSFQYLGWSFIPSQSILDSLDAIEDVIMIGYPNGLYDASNYLPVIRHGKTSSHPALDYNNRKEGLVDMTCIPGSSGSPIFIHNVGTYYSKMKKGTCLGDRIIFLGIEFSMPAQTTPVYEYIINPTTGTIVGEKITRFFIKGSINLGNYIKSSELNGFKPIMKSLSLI